MTALKNFTPREIVSELDRYIVGQTAAKRAVAVALRNRWRRQHVREDLREEIYPKNIILIGPTGVGKTEIARRLAKLANAPFVKVEASKFTEVGYVGRDVDAMIRDLVDGAVKMVRDEEMENVRVKAQDNAEERILDMLVPAREAQATPAQGGEADFDTRARTREKMRQMLREGRLDDRYVEFESSQSPMTFMQVFSPQGNEEIGLNLKDMLGNLMPQNRKRRRVKVPEAVKILIEEEAGKLLDMEEITRAAIARAEQHGIVFIDEIDKIAGREKSHGPDVSREGVQRDLLPIVEGSTVQTKYGLVRTDHILFIAAGAFHVAKVSDLIPEMQGRFPIRVELNALGVADFLRILQEPQNSLPRQYSALLATENVNTVFTADGLEALATIAHEVNARLENIGARRLHTVMEKVLEELSFRAPEMPGAEVRIDAAFVRDKLKDLAQDQDLSRYIL